MAEQMKTAFRTAAIAAILVITGMAERPANRGPRQRHWHREGADG